MNAPPVIDTDLSNLLSNAIKYSPDGKPIEISLTDQGGACRLSVKDWGHGIAIEDRLKLFTRFQRLGKEGVRGTGLGLAIVKRAMELCGGRAWIEDNTEGGSIFCLEIPKA